MERSQLASFNNSLCIVKDKMQTDRKIVVTTQTTFQSIVKTMQFQGSIYRQNAWTKQVEIQQAKKNLLSGICFKYSVLYGIKTVY